MTKIEKFRLDLFNGAVFTLAPLLALPLVLVSLYKKTRFSYFFYSLIIAFISSRFVPTIEMDKSRHIDFFNLLKNISFDQFLIVNFEGSPDFIFALILFLGSKIGFSVDFLVFMMTFLTVYLIFKVYFKIIDRLAIDRFMFIVVCLFVFSISYMDLFSGIRFTLGASFVFYGYYVGLFEKKRISLLWLFLGVFTHFGVLLFVFIFFLFKYIGKIAINKLRFCLILSIFFILISNELLLSFFNLFGLGGAIEGKVDAYINISENEEVLNNAGRFIAFFNVIWVYIFTFILIVRKGIEDKFNKIVMFVMICTNVFISFPVIYNRYCLFVKLLLVLYLLKQDLRFGNIKVSTVFTIIFTIISLNQVIVLRDVLGELLAFEFSNWFLVGALFD